MLLQWCEVMKKVDYDSSLLYVSYKLIQLCKTCTKHLKIRTISFSFHFVEIKQ